MQIYLKHFHCWFSSTSKQTYAVVVWKLQVTKQNFMKYQKRFCNYSLGFMHFFIATIFNLLFFSLLLQEIRRRISAINFLILLANEFRSAHRKDQWVTPRIFVNFFCISNKQNSSQQRNFLSILPRFPSKFRLETRPIDNWTSRDLKSFTC